MKKTVATIMVILMVVSMIPSLVFAGSTADTAQTVTIEYDGEKLDVNTIMTNKAVLMVNMKAFLNHFGLEVTWNSEKFAAQTITSDGDELVFPLRKQYFYKNDNVVPTSYPTTPINGSTYITLKDAVEAVDKYVVWEDNAYTIQIVDELSSKVSGSYTEMDMTSDSFIALLEDYGNVNNDGIKNFDVYKNGFIFNSDDVRDGNPNMKLLRDNGKYMLSYFWFSDTEVKLTESALTELLGEGSSNEISSFISKLVTDFESTWGLNENGEYEYLCSKLNEKSYEIGNFKIAYKATADNSQFDVFIEY